jgi:alkanesulfonate monooxygenase SsuD/methylene tetrahydromethanopterin reductase-like flavin-dependent oxidoreductase (luciferase family)
VLRETLEAMRALWADEEASYHGEFVNFDPSWAWPKPAGSVPVLLGAAGTDRNLAWIARHAAGWLTTPYEDDIGLRTTALAEAWRAAGRSGVPRVVAIDATRPDPERLAAWEAAGVTDVLYGLPDKPTPDVLAYLDRLAGRLGLD